jgi:8-oxo-dGTP diphosphatase
MNRISHLGVYALINVQNQVALILKSRGPYTGSWDLPGGKIEFGESPLQALSREVQEEVGLRVLTATPLDIPSIWVVFNNESGEATELHHLGIIFTCEVSAPEKLRGTGDDQDVSESRWFSLAEARDLKLTPLAHTVLKPGEPYVLAHAERCQISSLPADRAIAVSS